MSAARIPLSVPDLGTDESAAVARCIADNWVSSAGPDVVAFERRVAELSARAHGVAIVNGTAALYLALRAAGVEAHDRVLLPDFTFGATANAVVHAGGSPVFLDVTEESWTLDPALLADAIRNHKPKAVVPVHVLGHPADMDAINAVCREAKVAVIEDAAGAIGALYNGRPVGGLGDAAMFSFNGNKTVTTGGGGMIVTDNAAWADRIRALSTQARDGDRYRYREASFNFRMPNLNAALGLAQLGRLDEMLGARHRIAARYDEALAARDDLVAMPRCAWAESGCWLYSVRCAGRTDADALVRQMDGAGIDARVFWEVLSNQAPFADAPRHLTGVAARLSGTVVSLPCSSNLTEAEQARVIYALSAWRGGRLKAAA